MAQTDIRHIKENPEKPTFANTIVALDQAGEMLNRVCGLFFNLLECDSTEEMQEIALSVQPMLTEYANSIYLDETLFERVKMVYNQEIETLTGVAHSLLLETYIGFIDHGANLNSEGKAQFQALTLRLSNLTLTFGQNVLAATNAWHMHIEEANALQGLPEGELEIAAHKAADKQLKGYLFDLSFPSKNAILTYADNRSLREEMYRHSCNIAYGGTFDNCPVILEILQCREQIAHLLGYPDYAEYALHNRMAHDKTHVYHLLDELATYSIPAAQREMQSLQAYASTLGFEGPIERWDYAYYAEKQKEHLFQLSTEALKPYLKLENVIEGIFSLAANLYGLRFEQNTDLDVYHQDVTVYEVFRGEQFMAVLYLDFHPRATKRSGAWMTAFREQYVDATGHDVRPLISLVMNFTPSTAHRPSLLTFNELTTFLHEFGHALNGILSQVPYATLSGTNSQRDFVELPSQLNENWATEYEFLQTFARHYETGEVMPEEYLSQLKKMRQYMAGYASTRQLSFGYLDMMWHTCPTKEIHDIRQTEHDLFARFDTMPSVNESCMSTSFTHIFSGGYAAGYYGYKWAEMLEADLFSVFQKEGIMNRSVADRYVQTILSQGGSKPAMEMFVDFMGREPKIEALLERDGLKNKYSK